MGNWWGRARGMVKPAAGLLGLCLLWTLGSLRSDLFPNPAAPDLPAMEREALPLVLLALAAGLSAAVRGSKWPRGRDAGRAVLAGLGLFVAPGVLVHLASGWVPSLTRVAVFSLVPVFAVILEPHIGREPGLESRSALPAALAAVAGTLCIFPVEVPHSVEAGFAFGALVAAAACVAWANCVAVTVARELPVAPFAAIASAAAAAGLGTASALMERGAWNQDGLTPELGWAALVALPELALLFWLLRCMTAVRMTLRFVLAPLMTILAGMALERPTVDLRTWLGLALIAGGAGWLLFAPEDGQKGDMLGLGRK